MVNRDNETVYVSLILIVIILLYINIFKSVHAGKKDQRIKASTFTSQSVTRRLLGRSALECSCLVASGSFYKFSIGSIRTSLTLGFAVGRQSGELVT